MFLMVILGPKWTISNFLVPKWPKFWMFAIIAKVVGSVYLWSSNWPQTFFQCRISNCTTSKPVFHFYQICSSTNFSEICSKFCPPTCPEGSSCSALQQADWRAIYGPPNRHQISCRCPSNLKFAHCAVVSTEGSLSGSQVMVEITCIKKKLWWNNLE